MKLQPQDLRLGITLYDSLRNKEIKLELKHFKELAISEEVFFERYKAIKLTEEKLLRFGFEDLEKHNYSKLYITIKKVFFPNDFIVIFNGMGVNPVLIPCNGQTNVKYIHQLQNLYFFLTNEELKQSTN